MRVILILETNATFFVKYVSDFQKQISKGLDLSLDQVVVRFLDGKYSNPQSVDVTLLLLPKDGDRLPESEVNRIDAALRSRSVKLDAAMFGSYAVNQIGCPECPEISSPSPSIESPLTPSYLSEAMSKKPWHRPAWFVPVIVFSSIVAVAFLLGCVACIFLVQQHKRKRARATAAASAKKNGRPRRPGEMSSTKRNERALFALPRIPAAGPGSLAAGSARAYTIAELEAATDSFNPDNVLGVGGFGRVYKGVLVKGTPVAVKVLIRNDYQGAREFFAEIQMLSRLHHRNLVKLLGVCHEDGMRMLVYELVPNGSVESHLHGAHSETAPLDWDKRMIIALGAARALAYLHEESNPSVIHRDFKASNILLENDYTPRVSDFGLAKSAIEGERFTISSRIMGTFGYVAPECAMTGHILVQSDVYSYGVVLLELLSGRKPVDLTQPEGQENLVTWARPLIIKGGLDELIDPKLKGEFLTEHVKHVASIAYICVDPESSNRPSMGEVVQSLKLVCPETDPPPDRDYYVKMERKHPILSSGLLIDFDHIQTPPRMPRRRAIQEPGDADGVGMGMRQNNLSVDLSSRERRPSSLDEAYDDYGIIRDPHAGPRQLESGESTVTADFFDDSSEAGESRREGVSETPAADKVRFMSMPFVAGRRNAGLAGQQSHTRRSRGEDGRINGMVDTDAGRARTVNVFGARNGALSTRSGPVGKCGLHLNDPVVGCGKEAGSFDYDTSDDFGSQSWRKRSQDARMRHEGSRERHTGQEVPFLGRKQWGQLEKASESVIGFSLVQRGEPEEAVDLVAESSSSLIVRSSSSLIEGGGRRGERANRRGAQQGGGEAAEAGCKEFPWLSILISAE
ncbi:hypothetical protein CBR_g41738 [Chara braunii]|uniref:Protein kinase domain-containing protein n=1 Tax=Chara braunii TaxID=69332 RepID=A0A388LWJ7_CHABU|nr:hypothetical protein CBR_g41738 [Chara braunii]|eukprot:GBG86676.1 hypothetical protein CBR_g41738 [Chara braunii]